MKMAIPRQVGKSLANVLSCYNVMSLMAMITIKSTSKETLMPIQSPRSHESKDVVSTL